MRRAQRWMLAGLVAGLGGFAIVALDDVAQGPIYGTDTVINDAVSSWEASGGPAHEIGAALTLIGDWRTELAVLTAAVAWMLWRREWVLATWCVGIAVSASLALRLLKLLFERARPTEGHLNSYAFPSGHTFGAAAVIGIAIILATETYIRTRPKDRKGTLHLWAAALGLWGLLMVLTAMGRVLVQDHWMSDVLASMLLGLALISGTLFALSRRSRGGDPGPTVPEKKPGK